MCGEICVSAFCFDSQLAIYNPHTQALMQEGEHGTSQLRMRKNFHRSGICFCSNFFPTWSKSRTKNCGSCRLYKPPITSLIPRPPLSPREGGLGMRLAHDECPKSYHIAKAGKWQLQTRSDCSRRSISHCSKEKQLLSVRTAGCVHPVSVSACKVCYERCYSLKTQ